MKLICPRLSHQLGEVRILKWSEGEEWGGRGERGRNEARMEEDERQAVGYEKYNFKFE